MLQRLNAYNPPDLRADPGKRVTRLEYQAYSKMAIQAMTNTLRDARKLGESSAGLTDPTPHALASPNTTLSADTHIRSNSLIKCAVHHRLGVVPVRQPSIVIAVSSPHRKEAFRACEFILEEIKLKAPIWKREFYYHDASKGDDEEAEWKANAKASVAPLMPLAPAP